MRIEDAAIAQSGAELQKARPTRIALAPAERSESGGKLHASYGDLLRTPQCVSS